MDLRPLAIDTDDLSRIAIWCCLWELVCAFVRVIGQVLTVTQPISKLYVTVFADPNVAYADNKNIKKLSMILCCWKTSMSLN